MYVEDILCTLRADLEPYAEKFDDFDEVWLYIMVAVINGYQRGFETVSGITPSELSKEVIQ
jgi:hypothetical protein